MKILVVFDINGVLAKKKSSNNTEEKIRNWRIPIESIQMINSLPQEYDIAVWTSTTEKNAKPVVNRIFKDRSLIFEWYRDQVCISDPHIGEIDINNYDTIKNISYIKEKYPNYDKIIIIDDSPNKLRFNPKENNLYFKTNFKDVETSFRLLKSLIIFFANNS